MTIEMIIKIVKDFSYTPGPRYISEGPYSGELFRKTVLMPVLQKAFETGEKIIIDLDGTAGLGRSFLEEISGGLIREERIPYKKINDLIEFVATEEPYYKERVTHFLKQAHEKENI